MSRVIVAVETALGRDLRRWWQLWCSLAGRADRRAGMTHRIQGVVVRPG
jgi:hypothetical protein